MYKVSILMATYNGAKYLREQINSLLRQQGVEIEILVRDDGSKDDTLTILEEYQTKGLLKWYHNGHKNVQKGFLDLCKNAPNADFYAFCDQDDVWDDDKLLIAVNALSQKPQDKPLLYYCGQRLVDENLNLLSVHNISNKRTTEGIILKNNVAGCTLVFNNKLLEAVNICNPSYIMMHDCWLFNICVAIGGEYIADSKPHINYRQHGHNVVGLKYGLKGKLYQAIHYINNVNVQLQTQSLYENYNKQIVPEYKEFIELICNYKYSLRKWIRLIFHKKCKLENFYLTFIVRLKIILRKL